MSKVEQAEKLYMRSLSIREEALGPDHPQVCPQLMLVVLLCMQLLPLLLVLSMHPCLSAFGAEVSCMP